MRKRVSRVRTAQSVVKDGKEKPASIFDQVSSAIKFIGSLTALLGVTGFLIVQTNLQLYTKLSPYNVTSYVYMSAGVVFLILFGAWIAGLFRLFYFIRNKIDALKIEQSGGSVGLLLLFLIFVIFMVLTFSLQGEIIFTMMIGAFTSFLVLLLILVIEIEKDNRSIWQQFFSNYWITIGVVILILGTSILYGGSLYSRIHFGGGQPRAIQLVGKDAEGSFKGLGISMQSATNTRPICQIAPLTDGVLVFDPSTRTTTIVSSGEIAGKIDSSNQIVCDPFEILKSVNSKE